MLGLAVSVMVLGGACSDDDDGSPITAAESSSATSGDESDVIAAVPDEAREAIGDGEPRSSRYWVVWSSCGEGSQADVAAANGGREAGWIILDDLLADPGISLGDHPVVTCQDGVTILTTGSDPLQRLARQVLTAELNRNAGSESCGAADESIPVAQALLASFHRAGTTDSAPSLEPDDAESVDRLVDLLAAYNSGELCR